jgi:hypothetical protein
MITCMYDTISSGSETKIGIDDEGIDSSIHSSSKVNEETKIMYIEMKRR